MEEKTFTVSEINSYINKKLKMDPKLRNILIKGEISNYTSYPSGHDYFTLKDEKSQIPAVMYVFNKQRSLKFKPENGMKVIIKGSIDVYKKNGKYQLSVTTITEDGVGNLHIAYEQLKKKLKNEGLFDEACKKKIPPYPKRIGVVTAQTGAAIKDIITTIKRRYPICEIYIFSTLVQGPNAPDEIVRQIKHAQTYDLDTLIVGRGGGSFEDLNAFNEENVAREIYNCKIPVISAVGHETDYTISDFVADKRAPTPTAAAELAVPKLSEIKYKLNQTANRINKNIQNRLNQNKTTLNNITQKQIIKNPESIYQMEELNLDMLIEKLEFSSKAIISRNKNKLNQLENSQIFKKPETIYNTKEIKFEQLTSRLNHTSKEIVATNKNKLNELEKSHVLKNPEMIIKSKEDLYSKNVAKLEVLNPLLTLKRGYTIAKINEKVITSSKDVKSGDEIEIEFKDGKINTKAI